MPLHQSNCPWAEVENDELSYRVRNSPSPLQAYHTRGARRRQHLQRGDRGRSTAYRPRGACIPSGTGCFSLLVQERPGPPPTVDCQPPTAGRRWSTSRRSLTVMPEHSFRKWQFWNASCFALQICFRALRPCSNGAMPLLDWKVMGPRRVLRKVVGAPQPCTDPPRPAWARGRTVPSRSTLGIPPPPPALRPTRGLSVKHCRRRPGREEHLCPEGQLSHSHNPKIPFAGGLGHATWCVGVGRGGEGGLGTRNVVCRCGAGGWRRAWDTQRGV